MWGRARPGWCMCARAMQSIYCLAKPLPEQSPDRLTFDQSEWPMLQVVDDRMRIDPQRLVKGRDEILRPDRGRRGVGADAIGPAEHLSAAHAAAGDHEAEA